MAMLFGRITPAEIKQHFTHVGWYFFVPVYLGLDGYDHASAEDEESGEGARVAVRNGYPEWLMDAADLLFGIAVAVRLKFDPDYEPMYPFRVTGTILKD